MLLPPWQYMLYLAPDDLDLKSSLEGGGPRSGGGCESLETGKPHSYRMLDKACLLKKQP